MLATTKAWFSCPTKIPAAQPLALPREGCPHKGYRNSFEHHSEAKEPRTMLE